MKNKIIYVLICTLIVATYTASASINLSKKSEIKKPNLFLNDDVPVWETGYSWTYNGEINLGDETIPLYLNLNELDIIITDDSGTYYKGIFGGDIDGEFVVEPSLPISIVIEELNGDIEFKQSNLGIKNVDIRIDGKPKIGETVLPIPAEATISISFNPEYALVDFPIFVGKDWIVPSSHISIDIYVKIFAIMDDTFEFEQDTGSIGLECLIKENVTAGGNTFYSYKITPIDGGSTRGFYYCPDVGNEVLVEYEPGDPFIELLATNYPTPHSPLKPDSPLGPINGEKGKTYTYTTKAIDPDNNQIKYGWDFDGDMFVDKWTDFFDSNDTVETTYTWKKMGSFQIRVKARDTTNKESVWSDPLTVSIPKNLIIQRPILRFLEKYPNLFPILRLLLTRLGL